MTESSRSKSRLLSCSSVLQEYVKGGSGASLSQKAEVFHGICNLGDAEVSKIPQAVFSMSRAMPCPPPMQAEPTAYFPPRRLDRKYDGENDFHL